MIVSVFNDSHHRMSKSNVPNPEAKGVQTHRRSYSKRIFNEPQSSTGDEVLTINDDDNCEAFTGDDELADVNERAGDGIG